MRRDFLTPEELTAFLMKHGYTSLIEVLRDGDPDLYKVIEAIAMVRNYGHGAVQITINGGNITLVSPTVHIKTR